MKRHLAQADAGVEVLIITDAVQIMKADGDFGLFACQAQRRQQQRNQHGNDENDN